MPRRKRTDLSIPGHLWQQPSGRWSARYTAEDGARPQRTFETQDEAIAWLYELDRRRRLGRYIPPAELTVSDLVERWLAENELYQKGKPVTRFRHRTTWERHVKPALGDLRVQEIGRPRLRQWVMKLAGQYSASLINQCLAILNGAFLEAIEMEIIETNPCARLKRPPQKRKPQVTWTFAECQKLWAVLQDEPMWLAVYSLMLATGMREGELRALTWDDVNFEHGRIWVHRTMTLDDQGKAIVGENTKTGEGRVVVLGPHPLAALAAWQQQQVIRSLAPSRNFVFSTRPGCPLNRSYWQTKHKQFVEAAGIPYLSFHGSRHSFATLALEMDIPIQVVSDILGHQKIQTTMNQYQHITDKLQRPAIDAMDERLFGSGG